VLQIVDEIARNGVRFEYLTGNTPLSDETFRENFEQNQGLPFNPVNFRRYRLGQLRRADAFLYVRTAMSESGAFEVCYNVFAEPHAPMFFAVWKHAPIKTTLLRELEEVCDVTYREFEDPEELRVDLEHFFRRIAKAANFAPISSATHQNWRTEAVRTDRNPPDGTIWGLRVNQSSNSLRQVESMPSRDTPSETGRWNVCSPASSPMSEPSCAAIFSGRLRS
jgi:hypothetical protein